jgi:YfiH family protein
MNRESESVVKVPGWERFGWLRHGFTTRLGGLSTAFGGTDLNLGFTGKDDRATVVANRERLVRSIAGCDAELVTVRQVHGTLVKAVKATEQGLRTEDGGAVVEADGLMTDVPGVILGIQVADCVPVLLVDTRRRVVAALHAGWRGTAAGMAERGVADIRREYGSGLEDLMAAVGPSIGACCYAVGDEVRRKFEVRYADGADLFTVSEGGMHLDLAEANRRQMIAAGLRAEHVSVVGECTACARVDGRRKYFSHRAEQGFTGRAMGMIGVVAPA